MPFGRQALSSISTQKSHIICPFRIFAAKHRGLYGRTIHLCEKYIEQGWVSTDDYENLERYLYKPYKAMGGNGTAEKLMDQVKKLPPKEPEKSKEG